MELTCLRCGKILYPSRLNTRYCSPECRVMAYVIRRSERNRLAREKVCKFCSIEFNATRKDALYCCRACKQRAYRQRKKATKLQM